MRCSSLLPSCVAAMLMVLAAHLPAVAQNEPAGRLGEARGQFNAAYQHVRKTGDRTRINAALDEAVADLTSAQAAFASAGDRKQQADCLILAARCLRLQRKSAAARTMLDEAAQLAQTAGLSEQLAHARNDLTVAALYDRQDYEDAESQSNLALRAAQKLSNRTPLFKALCLRCEIETGRGELGAALPWIEAAFRMYGEIDDDDLLFYAHLDREDLCFQICKQGDTQTHFDYFEQMAQQALEDIVAAHEIAQRNGWDALVQQCRTIAFTVRTRRDLLQAQRGYTELLSSGLTWLNPKGPGDVQVSEKFVDTEPAVPPLLTVLLKQMLDGDDLDAAAREHILAQMASLSGKADEALSGYLKAVELLEKDYRRLDDDAARWAAISPAAGYQYYYWPMLHLLERGDLPGAFALMESSRARVLTDMVLTRREIALRDPSQQRLYARLKDLRARIAGQTGRQTDAAKRLESDHRELLDQIGREAPDLLKLVSGEQATLDQVRRYAVEHDCDFLTYVVFNSQVIVLHIGQSGVHARSVFLPRVHLVEKVDALHKSLRDPSVPFDDKVARQFHLFLVQPAAQWITSNHLVVIPHDDLYRLPFEVFQDAENRYLVEQYSVSYAPSATALLQMKPPRSLAGSTALAVVGPNLPDGDQEAIAVAAAMAGGSRALPTNATEAAVKRLASRYDVLHIAAHGVFDSRRPLMSLVALAEGGTDDGKLTAAEMFALPIHQTRLVTLSACETGLAKGHIAGRLRGIPQALLYAGAGGLLLSRWKVDNVATREWMQAFYPHAAEHPLPEAARLASQELRTNRRYAHPYFWSPFFLIGR